MKETPVQQHVRLEAGYSNIMLWRNNVGVLPDADGRPVRFGLANESAQQNSKFKSSDLIGINPLLITPAHVGTIIGQFIAPETKRTGWHMTPSDDHAKAQLAFHDVVRQYGGVAGFVRSREEFHMMLAGVILRG
jgi:hypothetical protein